MNKQPFYHRIDGLLFTATQSISEKEFLKALKAALKPFGLINSSVELESGYQEADPGDPADLM